jgi:glutathione S-transferase
MRILAFAGRACSKLKSMLASLDASPIRDHHQEPSMSEITLYVDSTFASPYAMSAFIALTEKKIPFTLTSVNLDAGEHQLPFYRDLGLTGRVPALVHGDLILNESSAIVDYLEERFPAPDYARVLPADVKQRALARQVQAWVRSDLMPIRTERNTGVIFFKPVDTPLTETGQAAAERLFRIAERMITGENLYGAWSIADTELALMLNRLVMNGDPVPQRLADYARAQWQRPSVQQWMAQPRG